MNLARNVKVCICLKGTIAGVKAFHKMLESKRWLSVADCLPKRRPEHAAVRYCGGPATDGKTRAWPPGMRLRCWVVGVVLRRYHLCRLRAVLEVYASSTVRFDPTIVDTTVALSGRKRSLSFLLPEEQKRLAKWDREQQRLMARASELRIGT